MTQDSELVTRPTIMREWLDQTEQSLRCQAEREGLLGHGTLIGNGREFLIHDVLEKTLPQIVHIGTGQIIDRYDRRSTLITSQLPIDQWHAYLGDRTVADAILDRLVHNSYRVVLKGESMRRHKSVALKPAAPSRAKGH